METILQYLARPELFCHCHRNSVAREAHEARAIRGGSGHLRRLIRDIRVQRAV